MAELRLETPLFEIVGARAPFLRRLEKLGIKTVGDLLWHFPVRYEDYSKIYKIAELEPGQQATIQGVVEKVRARHSFRRHMQIVEGVIADDTGSIRAVWFNQPYLANVLKAGRAANFAGKVSVSEEGELYLSHPVHEMIRTSNVDAEDPGYGLRHTGRLVPVYPETRGLTSRGIRFILQNVFKRDLDLEEWIPEPILAEFSFPDVHEAIERVHFPREADEAARAKARFSFEELFLLQLFNIRQKSKLAAQQAHAIPSDVERVKNLLAKLPFELTPSQKKSLYEIMKDIERARPMNRLLQGDVGSGKTVVAAVAAIIAADHGLQTAFMAPTEILARQHFETMKKLFTRFADGETDPNTPKNPAIGLLTGTSAIVFYEKDMEAKLSKPDFKTKVESGEIKIVFGTHTLIQKSISFQKLGLVIVDEQHRFGVRQRAELASSRKGANGKKEKIIPHFLSMSATPIPRTLMLSIFGDLDLSLITELPEGRKEIQTKIVSPVERAGVYDFVRSEVKNGRQVFVICPRIEPEDKEAIDQAKGAAKFQMQKKLDLKSVKEEFEKLRTKIFPDLRIAMLHGQMKGKEKEDIMRRFKDREFDILVATSVVEVGVDVPNATIMLIEGADRFGLAQLYQFRGRVGRGEHQSYCFLFTDSKSESTGARLKAIVEAKNGFELAEKDLELRGPGQFFGDVQTGLPDIAMEALKNPTMVQGSRAVAMKLLQENPTLASYAPLKAKLEAFHKKVHQE
ncbi:MAG TPA: ATP-dependent DNA helicase RecG [Candidatus Paceibacterota bacterium]|nr:ATP-dependent DNA helicase RecG [Candidatus Paceibacterota bacterium]